MPHPNEALIDRLYTSFRHLDAVGMAECYHPEAAFQDEAFDLRGKREVVGMWSMLCENVKAKGLEDWALTHGAVQANDHQGSAHWEPIYRFSATGRMVHNVIDAEFEFRDGLIWRQRDRFPFWRWSRQALGLPGVMLGWTPILRAKVRRTAMGNLRRYLDAGNG